MDLERGDGDGRLEMLEGRTRFQLKDWKKDCA